MNAALREMMKDPKFKSEVEAANAEHVKAALADVNHPNHAEVASSEKARIEAEEKK